MDVSFHVELSDEQEGQVDYVFRRGNPGEIMSERFKLQMSRRDLCTLRGLEWLNDEVCVANNMETPFYMFL